MGPPTASLRRLACIVLLALGPLPAAGTGKGPVGIYVIDYKYAVITDSVVDCLLVIDLNLGGVVASKNIDKAVKNVGSTAAITAAPAATAAAAAKAVTATTVTAAAADDDNNDDDDDDDDDSSTGEGEGGLPHALLGRKRHGAHNNTERPLREAPLFGHIPRPSELPGKVALHQRRKLLAAGKKPTTVRGISLTGVASCDACRDVYISSSKEPTFMRLEMSRSLAEQSKDGNFSAFENGNVVSRRFERVGSTRMITMTRDGSRGYLSDFEKGVWSFDLRSQSREQEMELFLSPKKLLEENASGISLSTDDQTLYVTTTKSVFVAKTSADLKNSPKRILVGKLCGGDDKKLAKMTMHIRETAEIRGLLYVVGRAPSRSKNGGFSIFEIDPKKEECRPLAGSSSAPVGWRDGLGEEARFTRPHQLARLPARPASLLSHRQSSSATNNNGSSAREVVLTDIDNRAVRRVTIAGPLTGHSSTVHYDDRLWARQQGLIPAPLKEFPSARNIRAGDASSANKPLDLQAARGRCRSRGAHLCTPAALRGSINTSLFAPLETLSSRSVWTNTSCHSCWLRWPGQCGPAKQSDTPKSRRNAAWGGDYHMLATFLSPDRMRLECVNHREPRKVLPVCCTNEPPDQQNLSSLGGAR